MAGQKLSGRKSLVRGACGNYEREAFSVMKDCYNCRHHEDGERCLECCSIGFIRQIRVPLWEPKETKKTAPEGAAQTKTSQVDHTTAEGTKQDERRR